MTFAVLNQTEGTQFPTSAEMKSRALDLLRGRAVDAMISYAELTEALGLDPATDRRARSAVLKAGRRLLVEERKKLVNVRTEGYRIIKPTEHVGVAQNEQRRARRWLRESLRTVTHVALESLSETEVARVMTEQARAAVAVSMTARLAKVKELPPRKELRLPSADRLLEMIRKK